MRLASLKGATPDYLLEPATMLEGTRDIAPGGKRSEADPVCLPRDHKVPGLIGSR